MDLSIVIPAYEEGGKIARDVEAAGAFLSGNGLTGEIIVVDDGSRDNTAEAARAGHVAPGVRRDVIHYEPHRGKGYAVRTGMKATQGTYVMFADCGLCIAYGNALLGLAMLRAGTCDIAHGSRRHSDSRIRRHQPWHRRALSRSFKWAIRRALHVPRELTDTQCGFKMYRGDIARELYGQSISDGFMFDIEIILRATQKGLRIAEFPVEWACDPDSRLSVARTPWPLLTEIRRLKRTLGKGDNASSNWNR
jgi:dolichyl-phosphate beta-glucosyltransferase